MDEQAAKIVIAIGMLIGLLFWLIAINLYRKMVSADTQQRFEADLPSRAPSDVISDMITQGNLISAQARVERPTPTRLRITQMGIDVEIEAIRSGNGSRLVADYDDSTMTRRFQLGLSALVLIVMPLVVGAVGFSLWYFVAPNPNAAVRWQSLQVLQISHVLWPQFLVYALWKKFHNAGANAVSNLLVHAQAHGDRVRA